MTPDIEEIRIVVALAVLHADICHRGISPCVVVGITEQVQDALHVAEEFCCQVVHLDKT